MDVLRTGHSFLWAPGTRGRQGFQKSLLYHCLSEPRVLRSIISIRPMRQEKGWGVNGHLVQWNKLLSEWRWERGSSPHIGIVGHQTYVFPRVGCPINFFSTRFFREISLTNGFKLLLTTTRGWTTSDFLKSTFMWWKSSRSRLVANDVINEQISLELWQTPCA